MYTYNNISLTTVQAVEWEKHKVTITSVSIAVAYLVSYETNVGKVPQQLH